MFWYGNSWSFIWYGHGGNLGGVDGAYRYQIEVPEHVVKKQQPADYESKSCKKGWRRFHTATIKDMLEQLLEAEEKLERLQRDEMRKLFEKFDHSRDVWAAAVREIVVSSVSLVEAL